MCSKADITHKNKLSYGNNSKKVFPHIQIDKYLNDKIKGTYVNYLIINY